MSVLKNRSPFFCRTLVFVITSLSNELPHQNMSTFLFFLFLCWKKGPKTTISYKGDVLSFLNLRHDLFVQFRISSMFTELSKKRKTLLSATTDKEDRYKETRTKIISREL